MASWKTRNEVPDSDDEDIEIGDGEDLEAGHEGDGVGEDKRGVEVKGKGTGVANIDTDADTEDELALPAPRVRAFVKVPAEDVTVGGSPRDPVDGDTHSIAGRGDKLRKLSQKGSEENPQNEGITEPAVRIEPRSTTPTQPERTSPGILAASSPLTELSSSPPDVWNLLNEPELLDRQHREADLPDTDQDQEVEQHSGEQEQDDTFPYDLQEVEDADTLRRRSKRTRSAIQLNPYSIENQLYRRAIQHTGIAPVRIIEESQARSDNSDDYEPDGGLDTQDLNLTNAEIRSLGISGSPSFDIFDVHTHEDEFPSLENLLHHSRPRSSNTLENQNITFSRKRKRPLPLTNTAGHSEIAASLLHNSSHIISPPSSGRSSDKQERDPTKFYYPPGVTPKQLITPTVSSETRPRRNVVLSDDSDNENELRSGQDISNAQQRRRSLSISSSDSSTGKEGEADIQAVRRKIKGVLPASWLRIDQKRQTTVQPQQSKQPGGGSPSRAAQRGVARVLPKGRISYTNLEPLAATSTVPPDGASSDHDSDAEQDLRELGASLMQHPRPSLRRTHGFQDVIAVDSDSMEEDFIDPMLPTASRRSTKRKRMRDPSSAHHAYLNASTTLKHRRQTKISEQLGATKQTPASSRRKREVLQLSIVDVVNATQESVPDFLRIAVRTSRHRRDRGRQSPSRKVIQLGAPEQPDEAQETLSQWRERSLNHQRPPMKANSRSTIVSDPLRPISGNARERTSAEDTYKVLKTRPSARTHPDSRARLRQETLEQSLRRHAGFTIANRAKTSNNTKTPLRQVRIKRSHAISSRIFDHHGSVLPAQLEDVSPVDLSSSRRIAQTSKSILPQIVQSEQAPILNRYLQDVALNEKTSVNDNENATAKGPIDRRFRRLVQKRPPQQKHIGAPSVPPQYASLEQAKLHGDDDGNVIDLLEDEPTASRLEGLSQHRGGYTRDFDIDRFPDGSCIGPNTFLRKDYVRQIFDPQSSRDLMEPISSTEIIVDDIHYEWGPWNEGTSTYLNDVLRKCEETFRVSGSEAAALDICSERLETVIVYTVRTLYFLDIIDRPACVERLTTLVADLLRSLEMYYSNCISPQISFQAKEASFMKATTRALVFACQIFRLGQDNTVNGDIQDKTSTLVDGLMRLLVKAAFKDGISDIYQYQQALINCSTHWATERSALKAECLIAALSASRAIQTDIWKHLLPTEAFIIKANVHHVEVLERKWFNLFVVLPFLEISPFTETKRSSLAAAPAECWPLILQMIEPVMQAYENQPHIRDSHLDEYYRALLARCLVLIGQWRWINCERILRTFYDFFARRNLQNLPCEEVVSHPQFLSDFHISSLRVRATDKAFHTFLKILGSGLLEMSKVYAEKRMRGIAFRFTPNHSRSLPKEQEVRQEDLDALRNHHCLLCLLYLVLPPSCRPRISLVRDLIRVEESHRQACHISVRAWKDLTLFQLSSQEPLASLEPLINWHDDLLIQLLHQHGSARREVEDHDGLLAPDLKESMIASNQGQVEAVLRDALVSLQQAIAQAQNCNAAGSLLTPSFYAVAELFDASVPRINTVLGAWLDVIDKYVAKGNSFNSNSDSQDFGDWTVFDDYIPSQSTGASILPERITRSIYTLLSNCLASNALVEGSLVTKAIMSWANVAVYEVKSGNRLWSNFLDPYGKESWSTFLQTQETAKYTPLFLSLVIEQDQSAYDTHQSLMLKSWISALVVRESQLNFQALLTSAVLNHDTSNQLLDNPPFCRNETSGLFEISASELSQRRVALISCVLANMAEFHSSREIDESRQQEHIELLRTLMKAMKENYTALGTGTEVRGAYVDFVQAVVGFLQQYTSHIQPIDRFFTDAKNFPLPVHDPTYVVSRLKSYGLKLKESNGRKQLVSFLQSIVERAVIDGDQGYLAAQLQHALMDEVETGNSSRPTLLHFLVDSVLPAYFEAALQTPHGHLLVLPLLQALCPTLESLLCRMDTGDIASIFTVTGLLSRLLVTLLDVCSKAGLHLRKLTENLGMLRMFAGIFRALSAALEPLDYLLRLQDTPQDQILPLIRYLCSFGASLLIAHRNPGEYSSVPVVPTLDASSNTGTDESTLQYAKTGLSAALSKWRWREVQGTRVCEIHSGGKVRVMQADPTAFQNEGVELEGALRGVLHGIKKLPSFVPLMQDS